MTTPLPTTSSPAGRVLRFVLSYLLAIFIVIYLADLAWYQLRAHSAHFGEAAGSVHRLRLLAIPGKANKIEYQVDALKPEEDVPCVHSLFPYAGLRPCWYVARHANDPIQM